MGGFVQFARKTTTIVPMAERVTWWPAWAWPLLAPSVLLIVFGVFLYRQGQRGTQKEGESSEAMKDEGDKADIRRPKGILSTIYIRLVTKDDATHIHKTLGLSCLISFVYRFVNAGPSDMKFTSSNGTFVMILVHALLSTSSLIFKIPARRINGGYRIWPEYRLHSIVFACRSLATMLVTWFEMRHGLEPIYALNVVIVMATLAAADFSSRSQGSSRSNSIRDLKANPLTQFFFSAMQFHATMGCLLAIRRFSTQFIYVWIIQLNAFLMTLQRKNLAPQGVLVTCYGFMLVFGFCVASYEHHRVGMFALVNALGNLAAVLRLGCGMPKYLLWLLMGAITHWARSTLDPSSSFAGMWPCAYGASTIMLLGVGARKVIAKSKQKVDEAKADDTVATNSGTSELDKPVAGS